MVMSKALAHRFGKHFAYSHQGAVYVASGHNQRDGHKYEQQSCRVFCRQDLVEHQDTENHGSDRLEYSQYGGGCRSYILYGYGCAYKRNGCGKSCKCQRFGPHGRCVGYCEMPGYGGFDGKDHEPGQ